MALKRQFTVLASLALALFSSTSCDTDIDVVNEEANHATIVYGLLDGNETVHLLRINKSFAGQSAADVLAATPGINEYSDDELTDMAVYELPNEAANIDAASAQFSVFDSTITTKADGEFFSESNKVYYFTGVLDPDKFYRLQMNAKKEDGSFETVSATTPVIAPTLIRLERPVNSDNVCDGTTDRGNDEARLVSNTDYLQRYEIIWGGARFGVLYTSRLIFYYVDHYLDGTVERDSIVMSLGAVTVSADNTAPVTFLFNTTDFFTTIANRVDDFDNSQLCYREAIDTIQLELEIAGEELSTYRDVNSPQTGVIQERPSYTNVVNGEGIFSTRIAISTRGDCILGQDNGILLDTRTMDELLNSELVNSGQYTISKGFCGNFVGATSNDLCPFLCP